MRSVHTSRSAEQCVLVFTRYPRPGETKTRLIPCLGTDGAAKLQRRLTEHALSQVDAFCESTGSSSLVFVSRSDQDDVSNWLGPERQYHDQLEGDLGQRLQAAFELAFSQGAKFCVVIGIDCPTLTADVYHDAFAAMKRRSVVIAPASDGGYVLLGITRSKWSTVGPLTTWSG